jgi:starch phosphorylase
MLEHLLERDTYLLLADYRAYVEAQVAADEAFRDAERWAKMSILNVARAGKFSSDRAIREYCERIWGTTPVTVRLED